ncbi:RT26 protein, partial [Podilymbus podiceps]|nr:RT26 protein [Podilymbus podiceps]
RRGAVSRGAVPCPVGQCRVPRAVPYPVGCHVPWGMPCPVGWVCPVPHYISRQAPLGASFPMVPRGRVGDVTSGRAMLPALRRCCAGPALGPGLALGLGPGPGPGPAWGPRLVPARGRKTRHDPPAKSSVPSPPGRAEFRAEVLQKKREALQAREDTAELTEEHRRLMAWNAAENARQRARREERIRKEEEEAKRQKLQAVENKARITEAFLKEKEKEVLRLQEEAKTFITPENLDARIEECLDNPRNYNFAIDKDGRVVKQTVLS